MTEDDDAPEAGEAHEAARRATDYSGLLKGEDPTSMRPDDIQHWIDAYSELVSFKEGVLGKSHDQISDMDNPSSQREASEVDVTILRAEMARYRERLQFWLQRQKEVRTGSA